MTLKQVAILLIRIIGVSFLADAVAAATDIPVDIVGILDSNIASITLDREVFLAALLIRVLFLIGIGVWFVFFAQSLVRLFTKNLDKPD